MSLWRTVPHFKHSYFKLEGGGRGAWHSSLESTPCCEFPDDSPQSLNTDLLSTTSSLGSIVDRVSTESPDWESSLSGEVNGVLQENHDPEAFSVLEAPDPAPDLLSEDDRVEVPRWSPADKMELHGGGLRLPLHPRGDVEGGEVTELEGEPHPADSGPSSRQSPCQDQDSPAEAQEEGGWEPEDPQCTVSEASLLDLPPAPSSPRWAPSAEGRLLETRVNKGSAEETGGEQGLLMHVAAPGHLGSDPWRAVADDGSGQRAAVASDCDLGSVGGWLTTPICASAASAQDPRPEHSSPDQVQTSSDEEDIYAQGLPSSSSETSVAELGGSRSLQDLSQPADAGLLKSDQVCGLRLQGRHRRPVFLFMERGSISTAKPAGQVFEVWVGAFPVQGLRMAWIRAGLCPCSITRVSAEAASCQHRH